MIIVDASVAFKWLKSKKESHVDQAYKLLRLHLDTKQEIMVPSLLPIEIANALATKSSASPRAIKIDMNKLDELKLMTVDIPPSTLLKASLLAHKHKTSVYDMIYAAMAKENKTILYTSDKNFIKKTGFRHVKHISEVKM